LKQKPLEIDLSFLIFTDSTMPNTFFSFRGLIVALGSIALVVIVGRADQPTIPGEQFRPIGSEAGKSATHDDQTEKVDLPTQQEVNTFSIVAYDPDKKEWGIGVASKFLAVGSVVPWAKAGVGAVATQAYANTTYGPKGLDLLADGKSAEEVVKLLTEGDNGKDRRQVGIIDAKGNGATFTGPNCQAWAGGKAGKNYACQGNILAGEAVVNDMAKAFEESNGPLAWRIITALEAADKAGGDKRGKQSAAILIVREKSGFMQFNDRYLDFRVDDHEKPIEELARILSLRLRRPK
jgi:uncharacterized Ntn-hydrolase superfamily protein